MLKATDKDPFRRVIDIKARFAEKPLEMKNDAFTVRIAQFAEDTMRVVIARKESFNTVVSPREDNSLIIEIELPPEERKSAAEPSAATAQSKQPRPLIVIDAGHGGRDTGAIGNKKVYEKDIALKVALQTAQILRERGFDVNLTREKDIYLTLQERTNLANRVKADLFVSIHGNASPAGAKLEGIETFFLSPARSDRAKDVAAQENSATMENMARYSKETFLNFLNRETVVQSNKLAIDIQRGMLQNVREEFPSALDNGVREGPFWVLVGAQMPAALVEVGYITHTEEVKKLLSAAYQKRIAEGIATGIESYFANLNR